MILNTALLYTRNWHVPIILRLLQYFNEKFPIAFQGPTLYEKKTENPDIIAVLIPPNTSGQQTSLKPKTLQNQRRFLLTHHPTPVGIVTHARASDFFLCQDNEPSFVYNTIECDRKVQNISLSFDNAPTGSGVSDNDGCVFLTFHVHFHLSSKFSFL